MTVASSHLPRAGHGAYPKLAVDRLGLALFIASESFLFLVLISVRFALAGLERPADLELKLGLAVTAVLLASSVAGYQALRAVRRDDRAGLVRWLGATLLLGALFLVGLAFEWSEGLAAFPPSRRYGTAFFALTGMHGLHVASGLAVVALVLLRARSGSYSSRSHWAVEAAVRYWTFVDVVWLFIFPTLYLL